MDPSDPIRLADIQPPPTLTQAEPTLTQAEAAVWRRVAPDLDALGTVTRADLVAVRFLVQALAAADRLACPDGGDPALAADFADLAADWRERLADGGSRGR